MLTLYKKCMSERYIPKIYLIILEYGILHENIYSKLFLPKKN